MIYKIIYIISTTLLIGFLSMALMLTLDEIANTDEDYSEYGYGQYCY